MGEAPAQPTSATDPARATVTRQEFARLLGIGIATLDRNRSKLPAPLSIGRRVLWLRTAVLAYVSGKQG
ncbi:helix-turn-helix transcriptional regulator [Frigoriglobus tundricola]|uniref:Helix-turn-helix domain-containing protein n=1 Tax=Frigoriglobus tundricola TaxID=2774151 RepID=A0A6M5YFZ7_9BACT|nr:hypothetical protein [Frigoriglobus tundricola]QJW92935.1 hypothetical protein FTUN_0433 [Frigoriglobus tundricola]